MKKKLGWKIIELFSLDRRFLRSPKQQVIARKLRILHTGIENERQLYKSYLAGKIEYLFLGVSAVLFLLLVLFMTSEEDGNLIGYELVRNGYEDMEKTIYLRAQSEGMEEDIEVNMEPLHYKKEQLDSMAQEVFTQIPEQIFDYQKVTGEGVYIIKNHIELPERLEGYPFEFSWESNDYDVMDSNGIITLKESDDFREVVLSVVLSCYDYSWEKNYLLEVYKSEVIWKEEFADVITKKIEELDNALAEEERLILPTQLEGHAIKYEEKTDNIFLIVAGFGIIVVILLWFLPDNRLEKQIEERNRQLSIDYAKVVGKLTLYMGAGASFRTAVSKIVQNANTDRFYAKELELVMRELENGISEQQAIEGLSQRCKIPCYMKLSVLMNQHIRKGNNSLQKQLNGEMEKAFEERKNQARKCGEEAGTKLLFPMMLMLLVVLVMIMYPAFVSFTI